MEKQIIKDTEYISKSTRVYRSSNKQIVTDGAAENPCFNDVGEYIEITENNKTTLLGSINEIDFPEINNSEFTPVLTNDGILFFHNSNDNNTSNTHIIIAYDLLASNNTEFNNIHSEAVSYGRENLLRSYHIFTVNDNKIVPIKIVDSDSEKIIYVDCDEIDGYDVYQENYFKKEDTDPIENLSSVKIMKLTTLNYKTLSGTISEVKVSLDNNNWTDISLASKYKTGFVDISNRLMYIKFTGTGIIEVWG